MEGTGQMRSKKMRVLMPATNGRDYVTTADIKSSGGSIVTLHNISGMPSTLEMDVAASRVIGRKRSGRRGNRAKRGTK